MAFLLAVLLTAAGARAQLPIPAGPKAPTRQSYLKKVAAAAPQLDKEYDRHTKDPPELREKAHQLLIAVQHGATKPAVKLSRRATYQLGSELMAAGSKDPLVVAVTMVSRSNLSDTKAIQAHCERAMKDVVEMYDPPQQVAVILWCHSAQLKVYQKYYRQRKKKVPFPDIKILNEAFVRWIDFSAKDLASQRIIWTEIEAHYLGEWRNTRERELANIGKKTRAKKAHPWIQHMLDARVAKDKGNDLWLTERNSGTDDEEFAPLFREAAKHYEAAWKLAPQFPEPAAELLQLSRGKWAKGTPRMWFDRTVSAELDLPVAYTYYRTHLRGEGPTALINFGVECAATRRYDTKVPFELLECLWAVENHSGENVWAREGVYEMVRDLCQDAIKAPRYMQQPQSKATRGWMIATQVIVAARAGRYDEIGPLWKKTSYFHLARAAKMYHLPTSLRALKSTADRAVAGDAKLINEIERTLAAVEDEKTAAQAEKTFKALAAKLKPDDKRIAHWRSILSVQTNFYAGRWAEVTFPEGCIELAGAPKWSRTDDRTLVSRGTHVYQLPHLASLAPPYEITLDIRTVDMPPEVEVAGLQVGRSSPVRNQRGQGVFFGMNSKTGKAATKLFVRSYYKVPRTDVYHVHIRAWHGHYEYFINGNRLTGRPQFAFNPTGYFVLGAPGPTESTPVVRYSKLRIRQISYASPPLYREREARIKYYTERIAADAEVPWHYLDRGNMYLSTRDHAKAIEDYEHFLKLRPKTDFAIMKLGVAYAGNGEYQKAIDRYQQVLKLVPNATHVLNHWAWLEATCQAAPFRDGAKALQRVKLAIKLSKSREREYYLTLAAAHAELKNFKAAQGALKQAGKLAGKPEKELLQPIKQSLDAGEPFRAD
ncbi:MAG: tetratricopeptide repeat protein [Planctomycetes bacterium]|nr:tetratricopeptide repeat protein [Planctomycetota bacterium]